MFVVLSIAICIMPALSMLPGTDATGLEKRKLAEMPALTRGKWLNPEFSSQFESYFSDNFGMRSYMVTAYSALSYYLLGDSVNEKVIAGKEGWLFYTETLDDYTGTSILSTSEINHLNRILHLQNEYLSDRGIAFIFTIAPNKNSIYGELMPDRYRENKGDTNLELLASYLPLTDITYVDLNQVLKQSKEKEQLYHRKDTHWNNYGAMVAYREILQKVDELIPGLVFDDYEGGIYSVEKSWQGDLEVMLLPELKLKDDQLIFDIGKDYSFIGPVRSYEDIVVETKSDSGNTRLLMFRDSFANALIPYISNVFGQACYSRAIPYDYSLVEEVEPDVVIVEIAERNLRELLKHAPLMPAPRRFGLPDNFDVSNDIQASVFTKGAGKYKKLYGEIDSLQIQDAIYEIYIGLYNGRESYFYEAFPVLENEIEDNGQNIGFSMLLDEGSLQKGTYAIQVIVKTGHNYFRPACEGRLTIE